MTLGHVDTLCYLISQKLNLVQAHLIDIGSAVNQACVWYTVLYRRRMQLYLNDFGQLTLNSSVC